jgi:hypothetical protein
MLTLQKEAKLKELETIRMQVQKHRQYEDFLNQVVQQSEDFKNQDSKNDVQANIMQIIERYKKSVQNQQDLIKKRNQIEQEKEAKSKEIQQIEKQIDSDIFKYTSLMNEIKKNIEDLNFKNHEMDAEYEGKLQLNNQKMAQFG